MSAINEYQIDSSHQNDNVKDIQNQAKPRTNLSINSSYINRSIRIYSKVQTGRDTNRPRDISKLGVHLSMNKDSSFR